MYIVQCTVYNVQCTMYSVQYTVYNVQCTIYSVQYTVYNVQCTEFNIINMTTLLFAAEYDVYFLFIDSPTKCCRVINIAITQQQRYTADR